jgi:hypothetical protein
MATAQLRTYPDFLILGAQRSGTSSLYRYLGSHPDLLPSIRKETQYFSRRFHEGEHWYRAHFPLEWRVRIQSRLRGSTPLAFEATPDYLFHPATPWRVQRSQASEALFIVILRDPVERAYSHYKHMLALGLESLQFGEALSREEERIGPALEAVEENPYHDFSAALRFSYLKRGEYVEQLERWYALFPATQFLILDFSDLVADPTKPLEEIYRFLGVRSWSPDNFPNYSIRRETPRRTAPDSMPEGTAAWLRTMFAAKNKGLEDLTGREFAWS